MKINEIKSKIACGDLDKRFIRLYDKASINAQRERYLAALDNFSSIFGDDREVNIYSVSGRSELAGNHTDHNCGKVIAASINLDIIAVVAQNGTNTINLKSEGFRQLSIDYTKYSEPKCNHQKWKMNRNVFVFRFLFCLKFAT
jgi:galactokinase